MTFCKKSRRERYEVRDDVKCVLSFDAPVFGFASERRSSGIAELLLLFLSHSSRLLNQSFAQKPPFLLFVHQ